MIDKELMSKFDRIQDLSVSEEMLGAYLEGNLSPKEYFDIESTIGENEYLKEIVDINHEYGFNSDILDEISIEAIDLPLIPDDSFIELDLAYSSSFPETEDFDYVAACVIENQYSQGDSNNDDNIDNLFEDDDSSFDPSDDIDISDYE